MTIEQKAVKQYGLTEIFPFAGYMLGDGTMLNFSYEGNQRDIDHRDIDDLFTGNACGTEAMYKMLNRGNIRVSCSAACYGFEYTKKPRYDQMMTLINAWQEAYKLGIPFILEQTEHGRVIKTYDSPYVLADEI